MMFALRSKFSFCAKPNLIINDLPTTIEEPIIQKIDPDASPVVQLIVSGPAALREVTDFADIQIKEKIETINGVGQVEIIGGAIREILIQLDPEKMRAQNINYSDVANAISQQNLEIPALHKKCPKCGSQHEVRAINTHLYALTSCWLPQKTGFCAKPEFPGGRVTQGGSELTLRTLGRLDDADRFNDIAIVTRGTYVVKLRDIDQALDTIEEPRSAARYNGEQAVTLTIQKQSGQNTVAIAEAVKERLNELQPVLPQGFKTEIISNQWVFIEASLHSIEEHLILGGILAAVVVFLFLWNFRSTIIAALAIPTSIISTFAVMWAMNYTLNQITMLALTLMVGIVIDDAIVVLENIFRFIEEKGMDPFQAAIEGTREIGLAVLATTLSLLAVFLPVGFMGGIVGRFMSSFGLTSAAAIAVSLFVSFTLTPMLAARWIRKEDFKHEEKEIGEEGENHSEDQEEDQPEKHDDSKSAGWYSYVDRVYKWLLEWSMAHRWMIVAICAIVIISIVPLFMMVGVNFTPDDDKSEFEILVRAKEGSTLPVTTVIAERIAADIRNLPGVSGTLTSVGGDQNGAVNVAKIFVKLSEIADRDLSQSELMIRSREVLGQYPTDLRMSVQPIASISGGGQRNAGVQYFISEPDLEKLSKYSDVLLEKMKAIPDAVDVDTSLVVGKPELRAKIDRACAADLGVKVGDIANALNALVAGQEVSNFNVGTDQYKVRIRTLGQYRRSAEGLSQLSVVSSKGGTISLDNLVTFEEGAGPSSIERLGRQRQVTLSANVRPGGSQQEVISQMDKAVADLKLDAGYKSGAAGASKELGKSAMYFVIAITLSFIFMYIVLAAQFESFIHPVTILLTLPLAVPFGILSLLVTGQAVNIFSALGLLLLFGVVKKNAILQIDHTNHLRTEGMDRYDAIIQANRDRLRPILMTTIALVAGMLPLIISSGAGAATNRSIGVLVVGGQSLCLLPTLLAVPVFYSLFDDASESTFFSRIAERFQKITAGISSKIKSVWANFRESKKSKESEKRNVDKNEQK